MKKLFYFLKIWNSYHFVNFGFKIKVDTSKLLEKKLINLKIIFKIGVAIKKNKVMLCMHKIQELK